MFFYAIDLFLRGVNFQKNQQEKIKTLMMTEDDNHSSVGTCTTVLKVKGFVSYV